MAIRKKDNRKLKLSILQVQEARKRFFSNVEPASDLAKEFGVSENIMRDAIHGKRGYATIPDDIPAKDKDPKQRAHLKSIFTSPKSQKRRNSRENLRLMRDYVSQGGTIPITPLHQIKPQKFDSKATKKAAEKHWKRGWE